MKKTPSDILNFGKHKGLTLGEVYQYQPSYIEWAIIHIPEFYINVEEFEKLPNPTTIGYKATHFTRKTLNYNDGDEIPVGEVLNLLTSTDQFNHLCSISDIKEMIDEGFEVDIFEDFKFPENILILNEMKYTHRSI